MFKVNKKDTRTTLMAYLWLISIVNFENVIACWVTYTIQLFFPFMAQNGVWNKHDVLFVA